MDIYYTRRMDNPLGFITVNSKGDGVGSEVKSAFDSMVMSIGKSDYSKRFSQMSAYWRRTEEVTARFFAEWVSFGLEKKGHRNHFLSRGGSGGCEDYSTDQLRIVFNGAGSGKSPIL